MWIEWFGSKQVEYEKDGEITKYPAQLNLGFSLGESSHPEPYFYSNPWPFGESLTSQALREGARWFAESWQGTMLPHAEIAGDDKAGEPSNTPKPKKNPTATPDPQ